MIVINIIASAILVWLTIGGLYWLCCAIVDTFKSSD